VNVIFPATSDPKAGPRTGVLMKVWVTALVLVVKTVVLDQMKTSALYYHVHIPSGRPLVH